MIKDKQKFNAAASVLLSSTDGLTLQGGGEIYIRSLEGPHWCVGTFDRYGDIDEETKYENNLEGALAHFHRLNDAKSCCEDY